MGYIPCDRERISNLLVVRYDLCSDSTSICEHAQLAFDCFVFCVWCVVRDPAQHPYNVQSYDITTRISFNSQVSFTREELLPRTGNSAIHSHAESLIQVFARAGKLDLSGDMFSDWFNG